MQEDIMELIEMVIDQVERDEHITDRLFCVIEKNPDALKFYSEICTEYGSGTINQEIGKTLKRHLGWEDDERRRPKATSSLIGSYTLLYPT